MEATFSTPTESSPATTQITADSGQTLDVDRHGGTEVPSEGVPSPKLGSSFELDVGVVEGVFHLNDAPELSSFSADTMFYPQ